MRERPQKRLVGWKQYLEKRLEKGIGYFQAVVMLCVAIVVVMVSINTIRAILHPPDATAEALKFSMSLAAGFLLCASSGMIWLCVDGFKAARKVESVALITRHNTGHVPEAETLVRGSERPAADLQSELLRAAQHGQETPAEELLRATQENRL